MSKLTEIEKLKYWIDAEFSILHIMFAVVLWQLTEGFVPHLILALYMGYTVLYIITRLAYIATQDKNYLRVPKK